MADAPYVGETATLFVLTRRPVMPVRGALKAKPPAIVYAGIAALLACGGYRILASLLKLHRWRRSDPRWYAAAPGFQALPGAFLWAAAIVTALVVGVWLGRVFATAASVLPWQRRCPPQTCGPGRRENAPGPHHV